MISFVIPAHNEAELIGHTLSAVHESARSFGKQLKRRGRFVIIREFVITSGRKVRAHSVLDMLRVGVRLALGRRAGLDYWYGPRTRMASKPSSPTP